MNLFKLRHLSKTGIFILALLLIFSSFSFSSAVSGKESKSEIRGKAGILLKIDLSNDDINLLKETYGEDILEKIEETGWNKKGNRYEKFYPAKTGSVFINNESVKLDDDGTFTVESTDVLNIDFNGNAQRINTSVKSSKELEVFKVVDFRDFMGVMDNKAEEIDGVSIQSEVGQRHYPGDRVHCNRFNGRFSDNVYYRNTDPRAWVNFIESDCDYAFFAYACWNDYTSDTNCRGLQSAYNYRNCSLALGHSNRFHYFDN